MITAGWRIHAVVWHVCGLRTCMTLMLSNHALAVLRILARAHIAENAMYAPPADRLSFGLCVPVMVSSTCTRC
jgi:hypothetical protein